ncbi:hypothetical protein PAXRUDRAFT_147045 [Paxillus rubicundulus Ve08.2h10]|uniref:Unplaced genomic scaffold scaffold_445, whole genome shotgun sequence n=1 Tax=Paxillus rubicundulus Ve08.2h10 TaxID=930991 RepID=A0A0D0E557_9AGAM|nr:hypothetical protein PAXRUDRAFT_147045 [Paxillus rubicundulus Ve08.2h10]
MAKKPNLNRDFSDSNPKAPQTAKKSVVRSKAVHSDEKEVEKGSRPKARAKAKREESPVCDCLEPPKKKAKVSDSGEGDSESARTSSQSRKRTGARGRPPSRSSSHSEGDIHDEICDAMTPPVPTPPRKSQPKATPPSPPEPSDSADAGCHAALTGMLVEALATSRATSMDASALYLALTHTHPYLKSERPKKDFLTLIASVLEAGRARWGMFEKVDSSGEVSRFKAPESRWFYVPERDEDRERASLISALMPRQKRNETKKYKQYYYRPLDKISRWDPEDAP